MHLGIILAGLAKYVNHFANRVLGSVRPLHDTNHGFVASLAFFEVFLRDEDIVGEGAVLSQEIRVALLNLQSSHESLVASLDDVGHRSLANMVFTAGKQGDLNRVAIHRMQAVSFGHKDRFAAIGRLEGVLAVCLSVEDAGHHLRRHVQSVVPARLFLDEIVHE